MKLVTVKMPEAYVEGIDELVKMGRYSSRSEVIRVAIRDLLRRELWLANELELETSYMRSLRKKNVKGINITELVF